MTVLVLSLLRLGDLILQRPLIEGLRHKHPGCKIHLLVNQQFSSAEFLFEGLVDRFIYFDRESLQKSGGEKEYNIFWGVQQLQALVSTVNDVVYDDVYNFTHNRLTAHIAGLIPAKNHHGIFSRNGEFFGLGSPWIRFFNSYFGRQEAAGFHYTELLAKALDIPLSNTKRYRGSANKSFEGTIVLQPLTSDIKKNWALSKYQQLARLITEQTDFDVIVLGAPFEKDTLETVIDKQFLRICDLKEAAQLTQDAAVLITGDTSIKHLAALSGTPILELSLGSSQPLQVGPYTEGAVILQPRAACGPCPHSEACSQASHHCGSQLSVDAVLTAALSVIGRSPANWKKFAYEHPELRVFRTEIRPVIGWTVECLSAGDKNKFDEILQHKTMVVEEINRRHLANKGGSHEQRTREVSKRSPEAS